MTFLELKRSLKKDLSHLPERRLALVGDTATQMMALAVQAQAYAQDQRLRVFDAPYHQAEAQLMDAASETYAFDPHYILLYLSSEVLLARFCDLPEARRPDFAEETLDHLQMLHGQIARHHPCPILQCTFVEIDPGTFGSFGARVPDSFLYQIRKLNVLLADYMRQAPGVYPVDLAALQAQMGREAFFGGAQYFAAKTAIALGALPRVAGRVVDVLRALGGGAKKCVILDLDGTLWGGVIGEEGLSGIELGELRRGPAFAHFQRWLKLLVQRGILLAVCSKNDEAVARQPFEQHPDMVLRLSDISVFVANWEDKAGNIRAIRETLNIGLDSMVFLDDNPFERNLVRTLLPDLTVPELPEDPAQYVPFLTGLNLFETAAFTKEDTQRTHQYQAQARRAELAEQSSVRDYLRGLHMRAQAKPFDAFHAPRIAQLSQRSNQFNLRTVRHTEVQILELAQTPGVITRYFTLRDAYASDGLVAAVILRDVGEGAWFIDTWIMSCRVLKRGMEAFIFGEIMDAVEAAGGTWVIGEYLPTAKNGMVQGLYPSLGMSATDSPGRYEIPVEGYVPPENFITKEE